MALASGLASISLLESVLASTNRWSFTALLFGRLRQRRFCGSRFCHHRFLIRILCRIRLHRRSRLAHFLHWSRLCGKPVEHCCSWMFLELLRGFGWRRLANRDSNTKDDNDQEAEGKRVLANHFTTILCCIKLVRNFFLFFQIHVTSFTPSNALPSHTKIDVQEATEQLATRTNRQLARTNLLATGQIKTLAFSRESIPYPNERFIHQLVGQMILPTELPDKFNSASHCSIHAAGTYFFAFVPPGTPHRRQLGKAPVERGPWLGSLQVAVADRCHQVATAMHFGYLGNTYQAFSINLLRDTTSSTGTNNSIRRSRFRGIQSAELIKTVSSPP